MNDSNEKKRQLIDAPYHIDVAKLRDDAEPKQLIDAPYRIVLEETSPGTTVESLNVHRQDSAAHQQQPASSANTGTITHLAPYQTPQQTLTIIQPNAFPYPTQPSIVQSSFTYPVQSSFVTAQYSYQGNSSFYPFMSTNFMDVELSFADMQTLKKENIKADIEIRKKGTGLWMELEKERLSNDEKIRYQKELDTYNDQRNSCIVSNVISANGLDNNAANSITVKAVVKGFIADRAIVRVHSRCKGNQEIQIISREDNRHISLSLKDLSQELWSYLEETLPDGTTPTQPFINRCFALLQTSIPKLTKSDLITLEPHQVMFLNGYLDLREWEFTPLSEEQRKKYYTNFSFDINYSPLTAEPVAYNALLEDALNGDKKAIQKPYFFIGNNTARFLPLSLC